MATTRIIRAKLEDLKEAGWVVGYEGGGRSIRKPQCVLPSYFSESKDELVLTATQDVYELTCVEDDLYAAGIPFTVENLGKPKKVVSIQVAAVQKDDQDTQVVPDDSPDKTHYGVYLRYESGEAKWLKDFPIVIPEAAKYEALGHAATLSMEHQVPIEKMA